MNDKTNAGRTPSAPDAKLNFSGGGKVSVSVKSILNSPKVQRQVSCVKEIAANHAASKPK
jgi:hypothetical protein